MDPTRRVDPGEFVITLNSMLFEPDDKRLAAELTMLVQANNEARGEAHSCFMYAGEFYRATGHDKLPPSGSRPSLEYSLFPKMKAWLKDRDKLALDKIQIGQVLNRLVRGCVTAQDFRDALPDCLSGFISETKGLTRTRPEAYTLVGDERAQRQFKKLEKTIGFYSMAGLLY